MEKLIEFKNATISINKKVILDDFSFILSKSRHTAIIGSSASGKSTVLKALCRFAYTNDLHISDIDIANNYNNLYKAVGVVFQDSSLLGETVYAELAFSLENLNIKRREIDERVNEIAEYFSLAKYLKNDPSYLTNDLKMLLRIASFLVAKPIAIALDDLFIYLTKEQKELVMKYLDENDITLLLVTSNIEDTLYTEYIYVLDDRKVVLHGLSQEVYEEDKILNSLGIGLPFIVDLTRQLKYYGTVDKVLMSNEDLAGALWK